MPKIAETHASELNRQQALLKRLMTDNTDHARTMTLFFQQHARLHAQSMASTEPWSLEDDVLAGLSDESLRRIPAGAEHSIAWLLWHIARCEDITLNLLVAGGQQELLSGGWLERLQISLRDTGNTMSLDEITAFSRAVDLQALRAYRQSVGRRTREIVKPLGPADLKRKVEPARLQRIWDEGAVLPGASGIVDYWGKRTVSGLLLMPASRHLLTHLTEAIKVSKKK
jgi:hypothetical protein